MDGWMNDGWMDGWMHRHSDHSSHMVIEKTIETSSQELGIPNQNGPAMDGRMDTQMPIWSDKVVY